MSIKLVCRSIILLIPTISYGVDIYIRNATGINYMADINYQYCETVKNNDAALQLIYGHDALIASVDSKICSPVRIIVHGLTQIDLDVNSNNIVAISYLKDLTRAKISGTGMVIPEVINMLITHFSSRDKIDVNLVMQVYLEFVYQQTSHTESTNAIIYILLSECGKFTLKRLHD